MRRHLTRYGALAFAAYNVVALTVAWPLIRAAYSALGAQSAETAAIYARLLAIAAARLSHG